VTSRPSFPHRLALLLVAALLACVALCPASALGATGDLSFNDCFGVLTGCGTTTPTSAMYGPLSVAVSADGNNVYVAASNATAIDTFARNATNGALAFVGCIGDDTGCTTTSPANAVDGPRSVTVSPDGLSVYATTAESQAIDTFSRNPATGALTFDNCIGNDPPGCTKTSPSGALDTAVSVAVSPDGGSVYVTGSYENVLDAFARNASTGALTFAGCVGPYSGCTATNPANALEGPVSVTVSADGSNVYVAASQANVLDTLTRNAASSALTFSGCTGEDTGCTSTTPTNAVTQVSSVAVSADGQSAYATAIGSNAIDVFSRSPTSGLLSFANCVGEDAGCTHTTPANALAGPDSVALSADGSSVYALSYGSNAIDRFSRQVPPPVSMTPTGPATATPAILPAPASPAPAPTPSAPQATRTTRATVGDQQIILTTPSPLTCTTTGKTLGVTLSSTTVSHSKAAKLRFANVAFYLDRGIGRTHEKTQHTRTGKTKTVLVAGYDANATARHVPVTLELAVPTSLRAGAHTLTAKVSYRETKTRHGHKITVALTKTLTVQFTVC
jgi:DNA-binding beta-propeller fold protein YncE